MSGEPPAAAVGSPGWLGWQIPGPDGGAYGPMSWSNTFVRPPGMQHGGVTRAGGLFMLHPNELVMPLERMANSMMNLRLDGMAGGGGGGLVIQNLNIPVSVGAGGAGMTPADIQTAVVSGVRGRAGTEIMRAARRSGL